MSAEQLRKTFEEDATAVFKAFIDGLGEIDRAGGSVSITLEEIGLKGDEVNKKDRKYLSYRVALSFILSKPHFNYLH